MITGAPYVDARTTSVLLKKDEGTHQAKEIQAPNKNAQWNTVFCHDDNHIANQFLGNYNASD